AEARARSWRSGFSRERRRAVLRKCGKPWIAVAAEAAPTARTGADGTRTAGTAASRASAHGRFQSPPDLLVEALGQLQRGQVFQQLRGAAGAQQHAGDVRVAQAPGNRQRRRRLLQLGRGGAEAAR